MSVEQSGAVTPGHAVKWVTDNVIQDAGVIPAAQRVLATFINADFNSTGDQPIIIPAAITAFQLTAILVTNATISLTTAAGGFYTAASQGGTPIVAAGQVYTALTNPNLLATLTRTAFAQSARFSNNNLTGNTIYFSLTTPQGVAANADIYLIGIDLSVQS